MSKLVIPRFDEKGKFVKHEIFEVTKNFTTEEQYIIINSLPGVPMGYCPEFANILKTKKSIEITSFYDARQDYSRKLKNFYISVL